MIYPLFSNELVTQEADYTYSLFYENNIFTEIV